MCVCSVCVINLHLVRKQLAQYQFPILPLNVNSFPACTAAVHSFNIAVKLKVRWILGISDITQCLLFH